MQLLEIIPEYNSSVMPITRGEAANYLLQIKNNSSKLNSAERELLRFYEVEFEYDISGKSIHQSSLTSKSGMKNFLNYNNQKHFYFYTDSVKNFFGEVTGTLSQRGSDGDSIGKNSILLGEFGIKARGSLYNSVGYFLKLSNGQNISGNDSDLIFASATDKLILADNEFLSQKHYNVFEGYLRYQTKTNWLGLTFGRSPLNNGLGYIDKLYLANNTVAFDFGRLDIKYKAVSYTFTYGSINGDSVNRPLSSKNIAAHSLNINFSNSFRLGFWESVIISEQPFSFTYLNPVSFLTSADLGIGEDQTTENNTIIGIEMEVNPTKNLSFQSSLLIDDLTFGTLGKNDSLNENKFGWQLGGLWTSRFNFIVAAEYTHLDPFVYSHRSNKSTYTNYSLPLGHSLPPNSDEIALKFMYEPGSRLKVILKYQHQRSGEGIVIDSTGALIVNYGGNINFGLGDAYIRTNGFLDGTRINRDIFTAEIVYQLLREFYIEGKIEHKISNNITDGIKFNDTYYFANLRFDL